jgi:F420-0:gamma-glutamyl ligase
MSCVLASGMARDCSDSLGGIEEVLISERVNVTAFTQSGHEISAITQSGATNFYRYNLKKESGSLTSTATVDQAAGTSFYDNVLAFTINKLSATKTNEIKMLMLARLAVIVKDNNGKYWALGFDQFAEGSSLVAQTGQAYGDPNQYQIELTDKSQLPCYEVQASVVAGLTIA